jgi:hypothetical protein
VLHGVGGILHPKPATEMLMASEILTTRSEVELGHGGLRETDALLADCPSSTVLHGIRALHLAQLGRRESMLREIDRFMKAFRPELTDAWVASACYLIVGDVEGGAAYTLDAFEKLSDPRDGVRRLFLFDWPMSEIADSKAWAPVKAKLK